MDYRAFRYGSVVAVFIVVYSTLLSLTGIHLATLVYGLIPAVGSALFAAGWIVQYRDILIIILLSSAAIHSIMVWSRNYHLYVRMSATLLLLFLTVVAAALASGLVLTLLFVIIYVFASYEFPPVQVLLPILGGSTVCILGVVAWGERSAPAHMVSALGATSIDEEDYPELMSSVRLLSQQADIPVPSIYVAPTETPLSLTTGFRPQNARLVVSEGLLDMLSEAELQAVVAHELAHIKNRDTSVMTVATLPIGAANRVVKILTGRTHGVHYGQPSRADYADALITVGLLFVPPIWLCSHLLWASLSRIREFTADRGAVAMTGDPAALATALRRIDETIANRPTTDFRQVEVAAFAIVEADRTDPGGVFPSLGRPLTDMFATHPETTTRIERLQLATREWETQPDSGAESN